MSTYPSTLLEEVGHDELALGGHNAAPHEPVGGVGGEPAVREEERASVRRRPRLGHI